MSEDTNAEIPYLPTVQEQVRALVAVATTLRDENRALYKTNSSTVLVVEVFCNTPLYDWLGGYDSGGVIMEEPEEDKALRLDALALMVFKSSYMMRPGSIVVSALLATQKKTP